MIDLPHGVATEIRDGIYEELHGLDADATAARIAQLGDPGTIAREAKAEVPALAPVIVVPAEQGAPAKEKVPIVDTRGYAITSALVFAFGGFVVPVVGWFVGAVLVSTSALWRRWEKAVAILLPFVVGALIALVIWVSGLVSSSSEPGDQERNPLMPASYDLWNAGFLLVFVLIPLVGGWLLWRLRRR